MKEIIKEYGGVILVAIVMAALIALTLGVKGIEFTGMQNFTNTAIQTNTTSTVNDKVITDSDSYYLVLYDANGGKAVPESQSQTKGSSITLSTETPATFYDINGMHKFVSWNTKADGSGTSYAPGAKYTGNATVTLYAQWNVAKQTIVATVTNGNYLCDRTVNTAASVKVTSPATEYTIKYGLTNGTYDSLSIPFKIGSDGYMTDGTYTVYYKITATGYNDKTGSFTVTVSHATGVTHK